MHTSRALSTALCLQVREHAVRAQMRGDLEKAGLANITATFINLLGLATPKLYEPSLISA